MIKYKGAVVTIDGKRTRIPKHLRETPIPKVRKNKSKRTKLSTKAWKLLRESVLRESDYKCEECKSVAQAIHHIIPIDLRPDLQLDKNNIMAICMKCHRMKHPELPEELFNI